MSYGTEGINVRPPTPVEASAAVATIGEARQEIYDRALQRILGQQLQGQVLSRFTDGSFLVKVADTAARVSLPPGAQVGDSLSLTLVSLQPRPTFLLGGSLGESLGKTPLLYLDQHSGDQVGTGDGDPAATATSDGKTPLVYLKQQNTPQTDPKSASPNPNGPNNTNNTGANIGAAGTLIDNFIQTEGLLRGNNSIENLALNKAAQTNQQASAESQPGTSKDSTPATLSNTGRLINSLLLAAQQDGAPNAILGKTAIVQTPAVAPQQVALALHDTLAFSGLFYESHVVEWADGKRPIAELLREPQMQLGANGKPHAQTNEVQFPQIINLQLHTLEQQSAHWRGEIWPGQQMEWDVRKEQQEKRQTNTDEEPVQSWQSNVHFNLPSLGGVSATIHLIGERLHIQINTDTDSTASALRAHADSLVEALGAAGSPLDSLLVKQNDQT